VSDPIDTAKQAVTDEVARATATVDEARARMRAAVDEVSGGPATDAAHAARQVAALRDGLDRDLAALRRRLPDPAQMGTRAKLGAAALGIAIAAVGLTVALLGRRRSRRARDAEVRQQAAALARELVRLQGGAPGSADG
jgi:hypothetical protein